MGRVARVLELSRVDRDGVKVSSVKFDPGGGDVKTGDNYAGIGEDANPLPEDYAVAVDIPGAGGRVIIGYVDIKNAGTAEPGERRAYSRNSGGDIVAEIWLKSDGSITITNDSGSIELQASGDANINGVTIDTGGNITTTGDITAANISALVKIDAPAIEALTSLIVNAIEVLGHVHISAAPGAASGPMQPPA